MATGARAGWGGAVHLSSDLTTGNLVELVEVVSFGLPDAEVQEIEVTHLKSPNRRREFIAGMTDGGTVEVSLNYVPGSATDIAIRNARDDGTSRAVRFIIPDQAGDPDWQVDTAGYVAGYSRGPVVADGKVESTLRIRITGDVDEASA